MIFSNCSTVLCCTNKVYSDFDAALQILLNDNRLVEYPILCAEVTSRFSVLSKKVINVKVKPHRILLD